MSQVEQVVAVQNTLGEGPVWDPREQVLYWVDIPNHCFYRLDAKTRHHEVTAVGIPLGALAVRAAGGLVMAVQRGFALWDAEQATLEFIASPAIDNPDVRFNDGAVDRSGRFWAGTMDEVRSQEPHGSLYRLDPDHSIHRAESEITVSNGIGWSPDNQTMYFTDSMRYLIYAYDYDAATGDIENRRIFARIPVEQGIPDGLTVDSEGCVWSAQFGGWKLLRFDPAGKVERELALPVANPTSCTFGGPQLDTLYITTAWLTLSEAQRREQPWAGDLLRVQPGVRGLADTPFAG